MATPTFYITDGDTRIEWLEAMSDYALAPVSGGLGGISARTHAFDAPVRSASNLRFNERYTFAFVDECTDDLADRFQKLVKMFRRSWQRNNKLRYIRDVYIVEQSSGETNTRYAKIWAIPELNFPHPIFNDAFEQIRAIENLGFGIERGIWRSGVPGVLPSVINLDETDGPADPTQVIFSNFQDDHAIDTIMRVEDGVGTDVLMQLADAEQGDTSEFDSVTPVWDAEVNELADFDAVQDADNDLNDSPDAAHDGAVGLEITFDDGNFAYGTINALAINQTSGVITWWFNDHDLEFSSGSVINIAIMLDGTNTERWQCNLRNNAGVLQCRIGAFSDTAAWVNSEYIDLGILGTVGWTRFDWMFVAATSDGANNGTNRLWINELLSIEQTCLDNDTRDWDYGRFGMVFSSSTAFGGSFYMDTIKVDPIGTIFADKLARYSGQYGYDTLILDDTSRHGVLDEPDALEDVFAEFWHTQWGSLGLETDELVGMILEDGAAVGGETHDALVFIKEDAVRIVAYEDDGFWKRPPADEFGAEMELYLPFDYDSIDRARGQVPTTEAGGVIYPRWMVAAFGSGLVQVGEATTNLVVNSSIEVNAAGYLTGGTNTIARSSEQSKFGCYSLKATYQDTLGAIAFRGITLTAVAHAFGVWIYIPSDYDGEQLVVRFTDFVGATGLADGLFDMSIVDQWQYAVAFATPVGGDLAGLIRIAGTGAAPTAGKFIYTDGWQCEAKAYPTPTCIGDMGAGHAFTGAAHASTSTRTAHTLRHDIPDCSAKGTLGFRMMPIYEEDEKTNNNAFVISLSDGTNQNRLFLFVPAANDFYQLGYAGNGAIRSILLGPTDINRLIFADVVITWDLAVDELKIFIDGTQIGATQTGLTPPAAPWDRLHIGAAFDASGHWSGWLDEMFLLNGTVLTPDEILARYTKDEVMDLDWISIDQDDWHHIKTRLQISSGVGADDGAFQLWVDNVLEQEITALDNDQKNVDEVYYGAPEIIDPYTFGMVRMDFCRWWAPAEMFPDPASVDDIYYVGSDEPFWIVPWNIITAGVYTGVTFVYEYSDGGAGWPSLTLGDDLMLYPDDDPFDETGIAAMHVLPDSDWAAEAVNGITKYWIRIRITAVTTWTTSPAYDDVYNQRTPEIRIPSVSLKGDVPPFILKRLKSPDGGDEDNTMCSMSRIIAGVKSTAGGNDLDGFNSRLNCGGDGLPVGWAVTYGSDTSTTPDVQAPGGDHAVCDFAIVSTMTWRVRFEGTLKLRDYAGEYRVFLRYNQTSGDPEEISIKLRVKINSNDVFAPAFETGAVFSAGQYNHVLVDLIPGDTLLLPFLEIVNADDLDADLIFEIWAEQNTGSADLEMLDLILIPADEWIADLNDPISDPDSGTSALRGLNILDIDSGILENRTIKNIIDPTTEDIIPVETWSRRSSPIEIEPGLDARLYYLIGHYTDGWGEGPFLAENMQGFLVEMYSQACWFYLRGAA